MEVFYVKKPKLVNDNNENFNLLSPFQNEAEIRNNALIVLGLISFLPFSERFMLVFT